MDKVSQKLKKLPTSPGVYIFKDKTGETIYVGKATSLKDRVSSYFQNSGKGYARPIEIMISEVVDFETKKTDTVLEAYILEQSLIKKILPKYNVDGKDDKSFSYVLLSKEEFPKFMVMRATDVAQIPNSKFQISNKIQDQKSKFENIKFSKIFGPYTSKKQIETALKILRKIFPYHAKNQPTEKGCLDHQIGLCPGPYDGAISKRDYAKNIRGIRMVLEGKKKSLVTKMKKEMEIYSKKEEFEKAADMRNKIFALQHVQDMALISYGNENFKFKILNLKSNPNDKISKLQDIRIEGYDISNISGQYAVGSMVVFDGNVVETQDFASLQPNKNEYRKFKIKTIKGANDVAMMEEVLMRRFKNNWTHPQVLLLDGGAGQLTAARRVLRRYKLDIPILAVAKGRTRKKLDRRTFGTVPDLPDNIIEQIRNEAHRFAIGYHRKVRKDSFTK